MPQLQRKPSVPAQRRTARPALPVCGAMALVLTLVLFAAQGACQPSTVATTGAGSSSANNNDDYYNVSNLPSWEVIAWFVGTPAAVACLCVCGFFGVILFINCTEEETSPKKRGVAMAGEEESADDDDADEEDEDEDEEDEDEEEEDEDEDEEHQRHSVAGVVGDVFVLTAAASGVVFAASVYYAQLHWFYTAFDTALKATAGLWAVVMAFTVGWPMIFGARASRLETFKKQVRSQSCVYWHHAHVMVTRGHATDASERGRHRSDSR